MEAEAMQTKGEMQEETTGVFKNDANELSMQSENKQPDMKDDSNSIDINQQSVSSSTDSNEIPVASSEKKDHSEAGMIMKPKVKKGKVRSLKSNLIF